jgi:uncharacterized membrane protein YeaQ/YmgE (transglycosylase-associated protein family)
MSLTEFERVPMNVFADLVFEPVGIITWLAVGFLIGWLAGAAMKGTGYSIVVDVILGGIGGVGGGCVIGLLTPGPVGLVSNIVGALIGSWLLIMLVRFVVPGESRL